MTDRKISNFEFATLNYFLTRAFLIGITFNALIKALKQDCWIIPLISIIPAFIIILLINYIIEYKPSFNISEKIIELFNKKIGIVIIFSMCLLIFFISILNYLNLNNFIQSQFLSKTPLLAISIMFMFATFYILKKGINTISRTSNILFYMGFILLILTFLGLIPRFKIDNLKPFFISDIGDYTSALNNFYSFNILPMFLLTMIPKDKITKPKIKKFLIISYIFSATSLFIIVIQTIATFGYELSSLYEYPEFFVLKHVVLIDSASRVESILVIKLLFDIFIFNVFSIYFIGNSIKTALKTKNLNIIYLIICTLLIICTVIISKYSMYLDKLTVNFVPIVTSVFTTLIILLICIKIKMSK